MAHKVLQQGELPAGEPIFFVFAPGGARGGLLRPSVSIWADPAWPARRVSPNARQ